MNQGLKAFLVAMGLIALGIVLLICSMQTRQFRHACEQTCQAKGQRYVWTFVLAPVLVPECTCEAHPLKGGAR